MKCTEILPGVFHVKFQTCKKMANTFMRFQEHYESPMFGGKVFSRRIFKEWYRTTRPSGRFTYCNDWAGFNLPSHIFDAFRDGSFTHITKDEQKVLDLFEPLEGKKFYVITTCGDADPKETLAHEIAHALFYLKPAYKRAVLKALEGLELQPMFDWLKKTGYSEPVYLDEVQAYFIGGVEAIDGVDMKPYEAAVEKVKKIYKRHT